MKRRAFLQKASVGVAASALFGSVHAQARPRVRWRMVTSWPQGLLIQQAAEILAKRVEVLTEGQFQIRTYVAGEIVPALQVLDAVQQGTVECGHTWGPYYIGKSPSLAFDGGVPFGPNPQQHNAWYYKGGGMELMQAHHADFNVIGFPAGNTGPQMGGWFRKEIRTLADLRGLRMRIGGLGGQVMTRLGATSQVIPGGEIYTALERGTVDAAEWVGPYDDERLGLHKVARFYYYPSWWEPSASLSLYINLNEWKKLPQEYQDALKTAAAETNLVHLALYDHENQAALDRLVKGGVRLRAYSREILLAAEKASKELLEEIAGRDATFRRIYTAWGRYLEGLRQTQRALYHSYDTFIYSAR